MKRVLITGANSYIGNNLIRWVKENSTKIEIQELSVRGNSWLDVDFGSFDTVLHLAGIAHVSADPKQKSMYYDINTNLAVEVANKSKNDGVTHFIFMSSMIVYGNVQSGKIDIDTLPNPTDFYGDSKLQAENQISKIASDKFKVAVIRPPMIYGQNSKGNYSKLSKFAQSVPFFPKYDNKRSMLYIENLCYFLNGLIETQSSGKFFPQNLDYTCTATMVKEVAIAHDKRSIQIGGFTTLIKFFLRYSLVNKVFGDYYYTKELSESPFEYQIYNFRDSIYRTEVFDFEKTT